MSLRLAFYSLDLTGLLCELERLATAGVKTRLCLSPPQSLPADLEVLGLLSESPEALLPLRVPLHHALATPATLHEALERGAKILGEQAIPVVFGDPSKGDFVVFRSLHHLRSPETRWAVVRQETDLAVSLHQQTERFSLYDMSCLYLEAGRAAVQARLQEIQSDTEPSVVFFDTLTPAHQALLGELLWERKPRFVVGSGGVESALLAAWAALGLLPEPLIQTQPKPLAQLLVATASSAPEALAQQSQARESGFFCHTFRDKARAVKVAQGALSVGHSVSLFTDKEALGPELAEAVVALQKSQPQRRLVLSASVALAPALEIEALEWLAALAPGCPLCHVIGGSLAGCELVLQDGAFGVADYFLQVRQGRLA